MDDLHKAKMVRLADSKEERAFIFVHWAPDNEEINGVNRSFCPCPKASREAFLGDVIARANAILRPPAPKPATSTVTVKAGDTLGVIAAAHKLTLKALLAFPQNAKYRANPGLIHPGDVVRVK